MKAKFEQYVLRWEPSLITRSTNKIVGNKPPNKKTEKLDLNFNTREVAKEIMAHGWSPEQIKTRSAALIEAGLSLYANLKLADQFFLTNV